MATTIVTKSGSGAPAASDLVAGELAVDLTNKRLYTEDSSAAIIELGTNPSGNVTFGDNGKAIFGDGSDLQIFSNGTSSYIMEGGSGNLEIRATDIFLKSADNTKALATFDADGAVSISHNGSTKLATSASGISVTGSVTADTGEITRLGLGVAAHASAALNITTTNQHIRLNNGSELGVIELDSSGHLNIWGHGDGETINLKTGSGAGNNVLSVVGNNVGIGTSSPASALEVNGASAGRVNLGTFKNTTNAGGTEASISLQNNQVGCSVNLVANRVGANFGSDFYVENADSTGALKTRFKVFENGDVSFYNTAATTAKFVWDASAEMLTTSGLTVDGTADATVRVEATSGNDASLFLTEDGTGNVGAQLVYDGGDNKLHFKVGNNTDLTRMVIERDTGSVGIGTDSPSHKLSVSGSNSAARFSDDGTGYNLDIEHDTTNGITTLNQTNSGGDIRLKAGSASGVLLFDAGGSEAMRIDSAGNVGIGAVPEAWTLFDVLQIGDGGSIASVNASSKTTRLGSNLYYDGAWKRMATGTATSYVQYNGDHIWNSTASGTADVGFTETERMRIDSSGNVGIGTSSPTSLVHLSGTYPKITLNDETGVNRAFSVGTNNETFTIRNETDSADVLAITNTGNVGIGTDTPNAVADLHVADTSDARIWLDATSADTMELYSGTGVGMFNKSNSYLMLGTNNTERMRIDASGNLLVGKTAQDTSTIGAELGSTGWVAASRDGNTAAFLNRSTSDGEIVRLTKDGTSVGSIGTGNSGNLHIGSGDTGINFNPDINSVYPINPTSGASSNGAIDLGYSGIAFKDLYLSGGAYAGSMGLGETSLTAKLHIKSDGAVSTLSRMNNTAAGTAASNTIIFQRSGTNVGFIQVTGSATSYITSSDYRLKENVVSISGATERLKQLKPSRFNFTADPNTTVDGFLAHEVQDIVPEAIAGTKDAMMDEKYEVTPEVLDDDGNVITEAVMGTRSVPDYQGIDQSRLVPLLVATIQELEARIAALES